jgi:F-type H+-transporting ATPase subunit gamma
MDTVARGLALRTSPGRHPLMGENGKEGPVLLVVIGSDRGLCGAFNANINRSVVSYMAGLNGGGPEVGQLIVVGKKPYDFFRRRAYTVLNHYTDLFVKLTYDSAKRIGDEVIQAFIEDGVSSVVLVYNEFVSALQQRLVMKELLPVRHTEVPEEEVLEHVVDYLYEPDVSAILDQALRRHVHTQVWRALLESGASEHGARMTAMDAATENAVEMIANLTLQYNRARQAGITTEIIEVVSGADALSG